MGTEWWGFVHCMYGMQDCLNYNTTEQSMDANQTCAGAESGEDDDMALSGTDSVSNDECECTLDGVAEYCADAHLTSMNRMRQATRASCVLGSGLFVLGRSIRARVI